MNPHPHKHNPEKPCLQRLATEEKASITAEFAITLPSVIFVLALIIGAISIATERAALTAQAAEIARLEARHDPKTAAPLINGLTATTTVKRNAHNNLHCVTLTKKPGKGPLQLITVQARSCAAKTRDSTHG